MDNKHAERLERFNNLKFTKNKSEWEKCVNIRESDLYKGQDVDDALEIMEILDKFYRKINHKISEQGHSNSSISMIQSMISYFHKFPISLDDF